MANSTHLTRRRFLAATTTTAVSAAFLKPHLVFGAEASSRIDIGLIGCGGRGQWVAELFRDHGGFNVVAVADYFQDKADEAGAKFGVAPQHRFAGLAGYNRLLEQKLDAVAIESPPAFHPEQAAAAVDAGKHVYLAKPVAVDVPGCRTIEESNRRAAAKGRVFLVDFQTRAHPLLRDFAQRIHDKQLGAIISAEAAYQTGQVGSHVDADRRADPRNPELRLRAWVTDRALSGDVIVEQNIHSIDMACWMLGAAPISARGLGGKKRNFVGDCWDHFSITYQFPGDVVLTFSSKQDGYGFDDIMCRVYGEAGTADAHYSGKVLFWSREDRVAGDVSNLYLSGVQANIAEFHRSITGRDCSNPTVDTSVRSNLACILGRMAAYSGDEITWKKMLRTAKPMPLDLKGLKT